MCEDRSTTSEKKCFSKFESTMANMGQSLFTVGFGILVKGAVCLVHIFFAVIGLFIMVPCCMVILPYCILKYRKDFWFRFTWILDDIVYTFDVF